MSDDLPTTFGEGVAVCTNVVLIVGALLVGLPDGNYLPLTDEEEAAWARVNQKMAKLAKSKTAKRFVRGVERAAPTAAYVLAAGKIFGPRVILTAQLLKERRAGKKQPPSPTAPPTTTRRGPDDGLSNNANGEGGAGRVRTEGLGRVGVDDSSTTPGTPE